MTVRRLAGRERDLSTVVRVARGWYRSGDRGSWGNGDRGPNADMLTVRGDRGSFTAELAAGLPALMLLLLAGLTAVNAATTRAACLDAAREAALAASRGQSGSTAGGRVAPDGADLTVRVDGDQVTVTVRAPVRALGGHLPRIAVTATAVAAVEPGTPFPIP